MSLNDDYTIYRQYCSLNNRQEIKPKRCHVKPQINSQAKLTHHVPMQHTLFEQKLRTNCSGAEFESTNKRKLADNTACTVIHSAKQNKYQRSFEQYLSEIIQERNTIAKRRKISANSNDTTQKPTSKPTSANGKELRYVRQKLIIRGRQTLAKVQGRINGITKIEEIRNTHNASAKNRNEEECAENLKKYFDIIDDASTVDGVDSKHTNKDADGDEVLHKYFNIIDDTQQKNVQVVKKVPTSNALLNKNSKVTVVPVRKNQVLRNCNFTAYKVPNANTALSTNSKVIKTVNKNFTAVRVTNNQVVVKNNFPTSEEPNSNTALKSASKVLKIDDYNYSFAPVTNNQTVVNNNFPTYEEPKSNTALKTGFNVVKIDDYNYSFVPVTNNQVVVNTNFPTYEEPKNNAALNTALNTDFKVVKAAGNNFTVVPVTNNEVVVNNNSPAYEEPKRNVANNENWMDLNFTTNIVPENKDGQDVNSKYNGESINVGHSMDSFTFASENNITNCTDQYEYNLSSRKFDNITFDDFDINLDFLDGIELN